MTKQLKTSNPTWQSQKSALTRDRIIVATLECIVDSGYERTTMAKIAGIANVSLGSMQYHFKTKLEAIKSAVNYLHAIRLTEHQRDLLDVPRGMHPMEHAVDVYWRHLSEGHFVAYQDLIIAGRTDPELAKVLKPAYQRFVKAWRRVTLVGDPHWKGTQEQYDHICDVGQYLMEGLAYGRLNNQINQAQTQKVLDRTKRILLAMMSDADAGIE
ncbi:MAG: TetR/AcrR family transcriptional regulator [Halioglobus sp.]